jgi:hypothetical protein
MLPPAESRRKEKNNPERQASMDEDEARLNHLLLRGRPGDGFDGDGGNAGAVVSLMRPNWP